VRKLPTTYILRVAQHGGKYGSGTGQTIRAMRAASKWARIAQQRRGCNRWSAQTVPLWSARRGGSRCAWWGV